MTADSETSNNGPLAGVRLCAFESRMGGELESLIERQGGLVNIAPSMREVPLDDNPAAFAFAEQLFAGMVDVVILLTGVGTRALAETLDTKYDRQNFLDALALCTLIVRGPKPAAVLREWKVRIDYLVPEPNTWRDLLDLLDARVPVAGKTVAVQEYGQPNPELYAGLQDRGANVLCVPVYRWALPEDTLPLQAAIQKTIAGEFDVLVFTSAQQLHHVLQVAEAAGLRNEWLAAAGRCVIASIGPTASETLRAQGLFPDIEPEHPKMGHLVMTIAEAAANALSHKREV